MIKPGEVYEKEFFDRQSEGSYNSAKVILPLVQKIVNPVSVVDVGCGVGTWLKVLREKKVKNILGIDGDWVKEARPLIPEDNYRFQDLTKPLDIKGRYDLAMCLEVLEHLPDRVGRGIVKKLVSVSDFILFSTAIPGQTGSIHINERWQSYWADIFLKHGFVALDLIRPAVWDNPKVDFWYRQNTFLYVKKSLFSKNKEWAAYLPKILNLVHPISFKIAKGY